ncbi:SDR family oxidoreductase [Dermacoccus sp. PAMC28757]|uniref:SDR family NAD(P)-dependent oxidoreductase n=2 Tax=Micrococcales TaxID=85006 RepID=UPI00164D2A72|nr:SDR family oxidoreductase [Dermacoccus sp. PAMC28757]QNK53402.1 SDR family oxidoreductase [Dermacoccus sp. PAMC28757]
MDLQLQNKVVIVTGAGRGIGLATTRAMAAEGARVVGATRTPTPELAEVARVVVPVDLTDSDAASVVTEAALDLGAGIDGVVNCVGAGDFGPQILAGFLDVPDEQWTDLVERNLYTAIRMARSTLPHLISSRGAMVNVSSINAAIPSTGPVGYSEAKAALNALTKRLSEEFGPKGVRINTVSPGPAGTRLWRDPEGFGALVASSMGASYSDFMEAMPAAFGLTTGRLVEPEEVAALITFLVSPVTAGLVGAEVVIDSGASKAV